MEKIEDYVTRHEEGSLRVTGTRVTLASVVHGYKRGETPESIRQSFPTLTLEQVYGAITYYLAHEEEVEEELARLEEKLEELRAAAKEENQDLLDHLARAREEGSDEMVPAGETPASTPDGSGEDHREEAEALVQEIEAALSRGEERRARELSRLARERFPGVERLDRLHALLSPPVVRGTSPPSHPSLDRKLAGLEEERSRYAGQWVALGEEGVVASAESLEELREQVGEDPDRLLTRVP